MDSSIAVTVQSGFRLTSRLPASGNTVTAFAAIAFAINPESFIVGQYVLVAGGMLDGFVAVPLEERKAA
jgi:hypothetical protein